jgi:hypothetical protein
VIGDVSSTERWDPVLFVLVFPSHVARRAQQALEVSLVVTHKVAFHLAPGQAPRRRLSASDVSVLVLTTAAGLLRPERARVLARRWLAGSMASPPPCATLRRNASGASCLALLELHPELLRVWLDSWRSRRLDRAACVLRHTLHAHHVPEIAACTLCGPCWAPSVLHRWGTSDKPKCEPRLVYCAGTSPQTRVRRNI